MAALSPANLDVPEAALASLVPPPSGVARSREEFASEAGATFSPLSAARVLAGLVVRPLLQPERAARLTLAVGPDALDLDALLRRQLAVWDAPPESAPRRAALRRVAERVVLDALLDLGAHPQAAPEVRAQVLRRLQTFLPRLDAAWRRPEADAATKAHAFAAWKDVSEFLERPEARRARPLLPPTPPGRPIGLPSEP
jgi:hypothetical protein